MPGSASSVIGHITALALLYCWALFGVAFLFVVKLRRSEKKLRDPRAMAGLAVQAAGMGLMIWAQRDPATSAIPFGIELGISISTLSLMIGSMILILSAVHVLGKQWAVNAQISETHRLITHGPYAIVRNPIYTGFLGMGIATGLGLSNFYIIPPAIVLYLIGTFIRVRFEEELLRVTFHEDFESYRRDVPAVFPRVF